jgi:hypothetical protein
MVFGSASAVSHFYASRPAPRADGLKPHQKQKSKKLAKEANMSVPLEKDIRLY